MTDRVRQNKSCCIGHGQESLKTDLGADRMGGIAVFRGQILAKEKGHTECQQQAPSLTMGKWNYWTNTEFWKKQNDIPGHSAPNLLNYIDYFHESTQGLEEERYNAGTGPHASPLTLVFWRVLSWDAGQLVGDLHHLAQ